MALLWIEGFEGYGSSAGSQIQTYLLRKYACVYSGSAVWYLTEGRTGGFGARGNSTSGDLITYPLTTTDTVFVGCAIKPTSSTTSSTFISLYSGTTLGVNFRYNTSTGEISVYRGSTLLGTTTGAGIVVGAWSYVEMKVKCHGSEGTVDIKVGSIVRLSLASQNTQPSSTPYHDRLDIGTTNLGYIDDVYFCDNTGSINNDWIGVRKVIGLFPNEDSGTLQWTPNTGSTHYSLVNEATDGGDYVYSGTTGDADLWGYQDISDIGAIQGIQINISCRETAAQSFNLLTPIELDGEVYDGNPLRIGTSTMTTFSRMVEASPDTGEMWTIGGLNSAKIGVKLA